jgi:imidazolonepropionase-like amidohydrolase
MADEWFLAADRVFDGHVVHHGVAVGVSGSAISRIVPTSDVPAGAVVDHVTGTITPGLIDSHVHLTPWMVFGLLAAGVTTVRDLGNDVDGVVPLLERVGEGVPVPNIHWSGPLLEGTRVNWPPIAKGHASVEEICTTVDGLASSGIRNIKLYANATPELVAGATERAHTHGMRVLCHLGATGFADALAAGVDELQHLAGCLAVDIDAADWPTAAEVVAASPIDQCVTLIVWDTLAHLGQPRHVRDAGMVWVPDEVKEAWAAAYHARQPAAERVRRSLEVVEHSASIPVLHEAGRVILVGSDSPFAGLIPGFSLHDEAGLLVEAGMSALDVMRAMTFVNSEALRAPGVGRIEPGAAADLVLFDGDPTDQIADLSTVRTVWRDGVAIDLDVLGERAAEYFARRETSPVDRLAELSFTPASQPG